jgi:hypothetical protein
MAPAASESRSPPSLKTTAWTAASSASIVITTSRPVHRSASDEATRAPDAAAFAVFSRRTS